MPIRTEIRDRVAFVTIDNPPVNAVSQAVRQGLLEVAEALSGHADVDAVVLAGAGKTFIAGADVTEFDEAPRSPDLPDVIRAIETSPKPWLAMITGACLGAGLEIALGCRWRVGTEMASLGLPEVGLGIIPGAGGTIRTPRLIGVAAAVDLVTSGKPVPAGKARDLGLLDEIVAGPAAAADWLRRRLAGEWPRPVAERVAGTGPESFWSEAEARVTRAARGNTGPIEALRSIRRATELPFEVAMAAEREAFLRLRVSDQAAALRRLFFAERATTRPPELTATPRALSTAGVIGGGTMGAGIAAALLDAGLTVWMIERDDEAAERGRKNVTGIFDADVKRGRLTAEARDARLALLAVGPDHAALADCDLVIEAVFEDLATKRAVFAELARVGRPGAILATNTSYLDPREIFAGVPDPSRLIGLHFFSPARIMKLLEIVPLSGTSDEVLASCFALAKRLRKIPVRAGICDGFIGNRILKLYREQAERLISRGAMPSRIDAALRRFGMAMGVFEAQDLAGLDIGAWQRKAARARGETPFAPVADRLAEAGRLGRKTGGGWYDHVEGRARPGLPDPVAKAIAEARAGIGARQRDWTDAEIIDALVLPMVNEAAKIVAEGVARRPADVDLVEVHGYGFPRFRGGPVEYGRAIGFDRVIARLEALAAEGIAPAPCPQLREWAADAAGSH